YTSINVNLRSDLRCRQSLRRLLTQLPKPVNILGFEDRIAEKILEECEFLQLRVPGDVAVLSFGDDPLLTSIGSHNLSSIVFPSEEIGIRSAELLYFLLNRKPCPAEIIRVKPLELRVRNSSDPAASSDPILSKAIGYIRREIRNAPRVGDVAKAAGVSRRGLEMRFREKLDKSVGEQIKEFRMELALTIIRSTSQSMEEIAEICGFSSAAVFSRSFRDWTGDTPSSHRARIVH
ncbi:MAG: helix-turn-helix domain-containing protein, partial [Kiritimatiellae bacterium]|nr:helix-turn-helix domain-containing protein [Kiritimatiellia bacterium]